MCRSGRCYIHGLVRDERGQKMSKSKGNAMDPLELIDRYGADALRFTICALTGPGRDVKLGESRVKDYRGFVTKLWNAARFCEMNDVRVDPAFDPAAVRSPLCRWILDAANHAVAEGDDGAGGITGWMNTPSRDIVSYGTRFATGFWNSPSRCSPKAPIRPRRPKLARPAAHVFGMILRLLHPAMPFVTEELWHRFGYGDEWTLIREPWPDRRSRCRTPRPRGRNWIGWCG